METEVKLVVACHKPYWQCADPVYCYVEAGAALHDAPMPGILHDDTGDQISGKNETFCELTVLYWAWKNLNKPYLGLCHYRRFFCEATIRQQAGKDPHRRRAGEMPTDNGCRPSEKAPLLDRDKLLPVYSRPPSAGPGYDPSDSGRGLSRISVGL